ncbi:UDP-glycosyltransferase 87A1-like isoform X2 [Mercurialis annua]|uniref:UDP-glycosyltransferase 87A1-like isoform X2 n=1 Tax=Mercurialis annua TaxID=3986 RepID=UPI0024ACDA88|nr:UDP-glycosyltransferase 87A1-like isoform X2 [Mercurialis annua]
MAMEIPVSLKLSSPIFHIVAMPHAGQSHINAMINLCNILASKKPHNNNLLITFVLTEDRLSQFNNFISNTIRFESIPDVLPPESVRSTNFKVFFDAVLTKMEAPFEQLLDQLQPPATLIMADFVLKWMPDLGTRRNIPVVSFFSMSATFFSVLLYQNEHYPLDISENGDEIVDNIPGVSSFRRKDLPTLTVGDSSIFNEIMDAISSISRAQYLIFGTIYEFDPRVVDILRTRFSFPIYTIGPVIPYMNLQDHHNSSSSIATTSAIYDDETDYFTWLDRQPIDSVLYISFGSFLSVSGVQMQEFAAGLAQSGVKFLWVARKEVALLKESFHDNDKDSGLIVSWCDQLKVLCHPSVGGFWSHCGWNSVQEGAFAGLPFLTFPIAFDQHCNSKLIVEDWKTGLNLKKNVGADNLVGKEEIAKIVKEFMDLERDEGKQMRKRAKELQKICQLAIAKDGSLEINIKTFFDDISYQVI